MFLNSEECSTVAVVHFEFVTLLPAMVAGFTEMLCLDVGRISSFQLV